jgi:hypothetical protein
VQKSAILYTMIPNSSQIRSSKLPKSDLSSSFDLHVSQSFDSSLTRSAEIAPHPAYVIHQLRR